MNYPPGVTGNEPQITGEWPCWECGAVLPDGYEGDTCPDGCPEDPRDDYDYVMDREIEDAISTSKEDQ